MHDTAEELLARELHEKFGIDVTRAYQAILVMQEEMMDAYDNCETREDFEDDGFSTVQVMLYSLMELKSK